MRKISRAKKGQISESLGTIIFLVIGIIFAVGLAVSAGIQTCTFTGRCGISTNADQLVVAHDKSIVTIFGNIYSRQPASVELIAPSSTNGISDAITGRFLGKELEVAVFFAGFPDNKLETVSQQQGYSIVDTMNENPAFDFNKCNVKRMRPIDFKRTDSKIDIMILALCGDPGAYEKAQLYFVSGIQKYHSFPSLVSDDNTINVKDVVGMDMAVGDFGADGKSDLAFLKQYATTQAFVVIPDFVSSQNEQVVYQTNSGAERFAVGKFSGTKPNSNSGTKSNDVAYDDIAFFTRDPSTKNIELWLIENPLSKGGETQKAKMLIDFSTFENGNYLSYFQASLFKPDYKLAAGDFDGDGKTDIAVAFPETNILLLSKLDSGKPDARIFTMPGVLSPKINAVASGKFS